MQPPLHEWAIAFALTCLLELPVYAVCLRNALRPWWRLLGVAFALSLTTHPALWYAVPRFAPFWLWLLVAESGVVACEGLLLTAVLIRLGQPRGHAFVVGLGSSLLANGFSAAIGLVIL